jgi:hypothetical protein
MKQLLKLSVAPAALVALAFVATATPAAAGSPKGSIDYCRTDVTAGTRGCGYASLEQCQVMSSGRGGTCDVNPFPSNASSSAYAFQPGHKSGTHRTERPAAN